MTTHKLTPNITHLSKQDWSAC